MIELKIAKSYKLLDLATDLWNGNNPQYGKRMNSNHIQLMKQLFWLLKKQASNYQLTAPAATDGYLMRPLRVNNKQLAKYLKCSERTVRNLRKRLKLASWISEVFHGSNSSYEIHINPDLLHLEESTTGAKKNLAPIFLRRPGMRKVLPHTPTGVPSQVTNKLNELSGGETPLGLENQAPADAGAVENPLKPVEKLQNGATPTADAPGTPGYKTGYKPGRSDLASKPQNPERVTPPKKVPRKKGSAAPAFPATLPESMEEITGHLNRRERQVLQRLVDTMWNTARRELYAHDWLDERQQQIGKIALAEYLVYAPFDRRRWKRGANEVIARIQLAARWVERRQKAGKKAWIPIPEVYFDVRNDSGGFRNTKAWYKAHLRNVTTIKNKELLTKARNEYLRSLEDGAKVGPVEALRRILQRLGKRSPALAEEFKTSILNVAQPAA
ncbi:hypothetical protein [Lewinella sp. W8]|uniref:hypothetical protein n=1 Tax=Lewinella sp. W8 TaxID=2528208 RepID=UPI0010682228|nr:hypothetical protein [Lewinella sp. W8]MTB53911.1 hypothetical protein [Lewinella sp. W8]